MRSRGPSGPGIATRSQGPPWERTTPRLLPRNPLQDHLRSYSLFDAEPQPTDQPIAQPRANHRWYQFSLLRLMLAVTTIAAACGLLKYGQVSGRSMFRVLPAAGGLFLSIAAAELLGGQSKFTWYFGMMVWFAMLFAVR